MNDPKPNELDDQTPWYRGITSYQWLVLTIASLGWIFDVFEGQIFVASMNEAMGSLLPEGTTAGAKSFYNNIAFGSFLLGGAVGGVAFGALSDRIGRTTTMVITILMYSLFTCVTMFAQEWWQMAGLRFLVAMGVGGEWAVASAMVAEVFPEKARARSSAIFHASSVFGTYLAVLTGWFVVSNPAFGWRWGFAVGVLPALLTLWIRWKLREPERWTAAQTAAAKDPSKKAGQLWELFSRPYIRQTLIGVLLAAIGLATFWGVHIYGKDLMRRQGTEPMVAELAALDAETDDVVVQAIQGYQTRLKLVEMWGMFLTTTGGGLGLLAFGPLCERIGRRGAFALYHVGGAILGVALFQGIGTSPAVLPWSLLVFGFWTLGMHAGYAVYFPELYPTRLRGAGGGFCFNMGRIIAAPVLVLIGWLQKDLGLSLDTTASVLSVTFLLGLLLILGAPETRGKELPT